MDTFNLLTLCMILISFKNQPRSWLITHCFFLIYAFANMPHSRWEAEWLWDSKIAHPHLLTSHGSYPNYVGFNPMCNVYIFSRNSKSIHCTHADSITAENHTCWYGFAGYMLLVPTEIVAIELLISLCPAECNQVETVSLDVSSLLHRIWYLIQV
jgi:hypothetical protein